MKYVLVCLLRGKIEKYHQNLVKKVGPKFGENYMIENPIPSHITLKYPFETNEIFILERILSRFCKDNKSTKIKIDGFGNFRRFVSFLKVNFSKEAKKVRKSLLNEIEKINGIKFEEIDKKYKPHATISYGNTKENFDQIWDYLKQLDKPESNLLFDNVTILSKPKRYWQVHKIYNLK